LVLKKKKKEDWHIEGQQNKGRQEVREPKEELVCPLSLPFSSLFTNPSSLPELHISFPFKTPPSDPKNPNNSPPTKSRVFIILSLCSCTDTELEEEILGLLFLFFTRTKV
jgi:hypothetical protein